jgi:hypothetical protein
LLLLLLLLLLFYVGKYCCKAMRKHLLLLLLLLVVPVLFLQGHMINQPASAASLTPLLLALHTVCTPESLWLVLQEWHLLRLVLLKQLGLSYSSC